EQLALVAGTGTQDVLVDAGKRMARVVAAELPGASLESYQALEARVAADNPDWRIDLIPPTGAALPTVAAGPDREKGLARALAVVTWGSKKLNLPVRVTGADSEEIVEKLAASGISARRVSGGGATRFSWDLPT